MKEPIQTDQCKFARSKTHHSYPSVNSTTSHNWGCWEFYCKMDSKGELFKSYQTYQDFLLIKTWPWWQVWTFHWEKIMRLCLDIFQLGASSVDWWVEQGWAQAGYLRDSFWPNARFKPFTIPHIEKSNLHTPSQIPNTPSQIPNTQSQLPNTPSQITNTQSQIPKRPSQIPKDTKMTFWTCSIYNNI